MSAEFTYDLSTDDLLLRLSARHGLTTIRMHPSGDVTFRIGYEFDGRRSLGIETGGVEISVWQTQEQLRHLAESILKTISPETAAPAEAHAEPVQ